MARYKKKKESKLPKRADLKGMKIGELTVVGPIPDTRSWACFCSCSTQIIKVPHNRLIDKNNPKTHCGCKRGGLPKKFFKEYHCWWDTKARCHNPKHPSYKNYGLQGQSMCHEWANSFEVFLRDMGSAPKDHILGLKAEEKTYRLGAAIWVAKPKKAATRGVKEVPHPETGKSVRVRELMKEYNLKYHEVRSQLIKDGKW